MSIEQSNEVKIAEILAIQKATAKNMDSLTQDVKSLVVMLPILAREEEKNKALESRVTRLESMSSWVIKIVVGAVLVALLSLVIVKGL